jgi:hypothetical protein
LNSGSGGALRSRFVQEEVSMSIARIAGAGVIAAGLVAAGAAAAPALNLSTGDTTAQHSDAVTLVRNGHGHRWHYGYGHRYGYYGGYYRGDYGYYPGYYGYYPGYYYPQYYDYGYGYPYYYGPAFNFGIRVR